MVKSKKPTEEDLHNILALFATQSVKLLKEHSTFFADAAIEAVPILAQCVQPASLILSFSNLFSRTRPSNIFIK